MTNLIQGLVLFSIVIFLLHGQDSIPAMEHKKVV